MAAAISAGVIFTPRGVDAEERQDDILVCLNSAAAEKMRIAEYVGTCRTED
jgi:hypothetical protein